MNIRRFICSFLLLIVIINCLGLPAKPGIMEALQPDGSIVKIRIEGNAQEKRIYSIDGYVLTTDSLGYYVFADVDNGGNIIPSQLRDINPETRSVTTTNKISQIKQKKITSSYNISNSIPKPGVETRGMGLGDTKFPSYGEQRSLVILVEFSDKSFTIPDPKDFYTKMLNEPGFSDYGATGSARDYFISNSNGIFIPYFDVYGPVTLDNPYSYYGRNNIWGNDSNAPAMIMEACELLDNEIDFSIYDCNEDGIIDNVYVFYAGYGEADGGGSNTIWPHSWDISEVIWQPYMLDGVRLDHYACSNELQKMKDVMPDGIGTFCHEFSHVLGLPDLYSTTYNNAFTPYTWDILDHGSYNNLSRTPPNFSSFERYALDWMQPDLLLLEGNLELPPLSESNKAFIVPTEKETEFFLFENRQQVGFDSYLPGHGMLIWHIDYDRKKWLNNTVNNSPSHQNVDLIEANNLKIQDYIGDAAFPGEQGVTEFSCQTKPAFINWDDKEMSQRIFNIAESSEGVITFSVEECTKASINLITDNTPDITINGNLISVFNKCTIYSINGIKIADLENETYTLPAGIYICSYQDGIKKFIIP